MNFTHSTYLPNSEERLNRLRGIISKRPAAIILQGFSATELERRIAELTGCDICYCSVGRYWLIEDHILNHISSQISILMASADPSFTSFGQGMERATNFLERPENNTFISTSASFKHRSMTGLIGRYDGKLLFHDTVLNRVELFYEAPNIEYPLHFPLLPSLSIILSLVIIGGASKVAIFGADGGRVSQEALYYRQGEIESLPPEHLLNTDTKEFNEDMPRLLKNVYKTYGIEPIEIVNCSPDSHYTPFKKLSYSETFAWLKEKKRDGEICRE